MRNGAAHWRGPVRDDHDVQQRQPTINVMLTRRLPGPPRRRNALRAIPVLTFLVVVASSCGGPIGDPIFFVHALVHGTVVDTAGVPVDSAVVVGNALRNCEEFDGPQFSAYTTPDGRFSMELDYATVRRLDRGCVAIVVQPPPGSRLKAGAVMVADVDFQSGIPSNVEVRLEYEDPPQSRMGVSQDAPPKPILSRQL